MKTLILLLTLLFSFSFFKLSATEYLFVGARSLGLANANVTLYDVWSTNNNQAGLGFVETFNIGISYENRFGLSELGVKNMNVAIPVKWGTFGATIQQFGYSDYNENKLGLAYGMKINKRVSLGIQLDYVLISVTEAQTQNKSAFTAELGLQAELTEKLILGAHLYNIPNTSFKGNFEEKIPMVFRIGLNYSFSKKVFAVLGIEKNIDLPANIKMGVEYHPIDVLYFRGGLHVSTSVANEVTYAGGVGVHLKKLNFDLGFSHQTYIGYISHISLSYGINKK